MYCGHATVHGGPRLGKIAVVVFLENNHGKYLADMLFGMLQMRMRLATVLGVDGLLAEFGKLKAHGNASFTGIALNPLSSIEFTEVLCSLGYETKVPPDFGFKLRNIHFAAACAPGAKMGLTDELLNLVGPALPDEGGLVRVSTSPLNSVPQSQLPFEQQYVDVPATFIDGSGTDGIVQTTNSTSETGDARNPLGVRSAAPLVVPLDKPYSDSGNGVVSHRTAVHVYYNGLAFRGLRACPELVGRSSLIVQEAWPPGMLNECSENSGKT